MWILLLLLVLVLLGRVIVVGYARVTDEQQMDALIDAAAGPASACVLDHGLDRQGLSNAVDCMVLNAAAPGLPVQARGSSLNRTDPSPNSSPPACVRTSKLAAPSDSPSTPPTTKQGGSK